MCSVHLTSDSQHLCWTEEGGEGNNDSLKNGSDCFRMRERWAVWICSVPQPVLGPS